jgi:hypothetical protein
MQPSYEELAELARICARRSRLAESETIANELWRLAKATKKERLNLTTARCQI